MNKQPSSQFLAKAFLITMLVMLAISFIFAPGPRKPKCREASFSSLESNSIYFRNVRSYRYAIQEDTDLRMNRYFHKKSKGDPIQFMLIQQTINSDWHIRPYLEDSSSSYHFVITEHGQINLRNSTSEQYWLAAQSIYSHILDENSIPLSNGQENFELFLDQDEKKRAEQVLYDYFRLVGCN